MGAVRQEASRLRKADGRFRIRAWHEVAQKAVGGHIGISATTLLLVWWTREVGHITPSEFRCWFAVAEVIERRRHAEDFTLLDYQRAHRARFCAQLSKEVGELCRVAPANALRAVRKLSRLGLIRIDGGKLRLCRSLDEVGVADTSGFQELLERTQREVSAHSVDLPFPRRLVRALAKGEHAGTGIRGSAVVATVLGVALRCLYRHKVRGEWKTISGGLVKTSWIAEVFGVRPSSVKHAMKALSELGLVSRLETPQWCQQRHGRRTVVNIAWGGSEEIKRVGESAPRKPQNDDQFVPPNNNQHPSLRTYLHQNPAAADTGVCRRKSKKGQSDKPDLRNVQVDDLNDAKRMRVLFEQAVSTGIVVEGEASYLRFLGAAVHARRVSKKNACGLFSATVRKRRWSRVAHCDEDRARQLLAEIDEHVPECDERSERQRAKVQALVAGTSSQRARRGWSDGSWQHYLCGDEKSLAG